MLFFTLLCAFSVAHAQYNLIVNITQGQVRGFRATDGNYFNFYGVHYAGSTAGENRFKAPTPPPNYPGLFNAIDFSIQCARPSDRGIIGDEDCLTVSLFTSGASPAKPVLVWIEGEEYAIPGDSRPFASFVERDVVVVRPNYRLSIFGFLCLGVAEAPGNAGLKDLVQALKWIQENIVGFGGDPNNVILFGHGAGAAMVDLITMSPLATGLVHKAIVQSGSALAPWAIAYDPVNTAKYFGARMGYTDKSNSELAQLLGNTTTQILNSAFLNIELLNNTALFAPCIENPNADPTNTFLADAPINILKSGNYSHIPYIAGYTSREGTLRAPQAVVNSWLQKMQDNFTNFLQVDLDYSSNLTAIERQIRSYYFAERVIDSASIEDYLDYHGDTLILISVIRGVKERAATSTAGVRLYEFANRGTNNNGWIYSTIPLNGARHGLVINFLLDIDLRVVDQSVRNSLTSRYLSFFSSGNPTNNGTTWNPITAASLNYLLYVNSDGNVPSTAINYEEMKFDPHSQRMSFWNDLYERYYKPPLQVSSSSRVFGAAMLILISQFLAKLF